MQKTLNLLKSPFLQNSCLCLLGGISILGFAPFNLVPITLACYAGLYLLEKQMRLLPVFCFFIGQATLGCYWLFNSIVIFGKLPTIVGLILTAIAVSMLSAVHAFLGIFARKYRLITWPLWLTTAEMLRSYYLFSGFPWLLLGYSQIHSPWYKLIMFFGIHGTSFVTALIIACCCEAYKHKACILIIIIWLICPILMPKQLNEIKSKSYNFISHQPNTSTIIKDLIKDNGKYDFEIWPEASIQHPLSIKEKQHLTRIKNLNIIGGIKYQDHKFFNSTIAIYPGGKITYHDKYHLVAFGEYLPFGQIIRKFYNANFIDMSPANNENVKLIKLKNSYILPIMCYDISFSGWMHPEVQKADFLVSLHKMSWFDSKLALAQQIEMAQAISISTGKEQVFVESSIGHLIIAPNGDIRKNNTIYSYSR